jgi:branched-chain amino acid transport system ATP-binding protein
MLALSNALILSPRLLLLDEPTLGLSPPLVSEVLNRLAGISKNRGIALLVVEQRVREILKVADRVYVLKNGRATFSGSAEILLGDEQMLRNSFL